MKRENLISVLTPTFNRRETIHRVYESLLKSTYKNFEWIIVDDGSTDNTKELIDKYIANGNMQIRYFYQENQGKHIAMNKLYAEAKGKYCFQLDSDDRIMPKAMEESLAIWDSIKNKDRYWGICGRCIDNETHKIIGDLFPENMNNFSHKKQNKILNKIEGEKWSCQRVDIVKKYPYPYHPNMKFISESYIWLQISEKYLQYYTNKPFRIYYSNQPNIETLSYRAKTPEKCINEVMQYRFFLNDIYGPRIGSRTFKQYIYTTIAYLLNSKSAGIGLVNTIKPIKYARIRILLWLEYLPISIMSIQGKRSSKT